MNLPLVKMLTRFSAGLIWCLVCMAGICMVGTALFFFAICGDLPRVPQPLNRIVETPETVLYAATGERVLALGGKEIVPLERISPDFVNAVIATEDHRFWHHSGIDKLRMMKALWITLFREGRVEGASTITQQLAKNLFFSFRRSYLRKFREMFVAFQIEVAYSKEEILEAYLNQIPFGYNAYGIEKAAFAFFNKPAARLSLAEAALLAGLPKSPTRYNPFLHFERSRQRQRIVLERMVRVGYITAAQKAEALAEELRLGPMPTGARTGSYFLDTVISRLESRYGTDAVYHGGLRVTTTLDPGLQAQAVAALQGGLAGLEKRLAPVQGGGEVQGAIVALETRSGAVKALVGGRDYARSPYNRAVHARRLPGSGFKPFLYYNAFQKGGFSPATVFEDRPVTISVPGAADWKPRNFSRNHAGRMILKKAFISSVNSIAAQLVETLGAQGVAETARQCGIHSPLDPVPSIALGTSGVSPLELTSSYAVFANSGTYHEPFLIWRVEDAFGQVIDEHLVQGHKRLDPAPAYQVVDMMRGVLDSGTGRVVRSLGFTLPAAGKTGTTNGYRDAWFTGFTPTLAASVWVGYDRVAGLTDRRGRGVTGGSGAAPIWADFMNRATGGEPPREFPIPGTIRFKVLDTATGQEPWESGSAPMRVAVRDGEP